MASRDENSQRIKVTCSCQAQLLAPRKSVGKRVKCPKCSKILMVPDPGSTLDRMIYSLADEEYNNPPLEQQPPPPQPVATEKGKLCPKCNGEMTADAVFCVKCGFHLESGAAVSGPTESCGNFFTRLFKRKK